MKFGVMQGVLGDPLPQVFQTAAQLGFNGVEVDWMCAEDAAEGKALGPEKRAALKAAAAAAKVEIPSVCAHFLNGGGLADPNPEKQRLGLEAVRAGLALCRGLGAHALLVPFFGGGDIGGADGAERLAGHLKTLASEAEKAQVSIGIEHTLPGAEAAALLAQVNSPRIADYWDMANCMGLGYDPVSEVKALSRHIVQVHAKEFAPDNGLQGTRSAPRFDRLNQKPFGQGTVPVREVLKALRQIGYDGYIVLETGAFGEKKASARAALDALKAAL